MSEEVPPGFTQKGFWTQLSRNPKTALVLASLGIALISLIAANHVGSNNASPSKNVDEYKQTGIMSPNDPGKAMDAAKPIRVGLNAKDLKGNQASLYSDCGSDIVPGEYVWLTNDADDTFMTTIRVKVVQVQDRGNNTSNGCLFLGREATQKLAIFDKKPGIKTLSLRQQDPTPHNPRATKKDGVQQNGLVNVNDGNVNVNLPASKK